MDKKEFQPYVPANKVMPEFTVVSILLGAILAVVFVPHESVRLLRPVCVGLAVGGLSHVILDMLTPQGVPFLPFSRKNRFSLKLCKTGGIGEYLFLAAMLAGMAFFLRDDIVRQAQGLLPALFGRV